MAKIRLARRQRDENGKTVKDHVLERWVQNPTKSPREDAEIAESGLWILIAQLQRFGTGCRVGETIAVQRSQEKKAGRELRSAFVSM